jgi:hypothetical protein
MFRFPNDPQLVRVDNILTGILNDERITVFMAETGLAFF